MKKIFMAGILLCALQGAARADISDSGNAVIGGTMTVQGNAFSVGGSTLVVVNGRVGIGASAPAVGNDGSSVGMVHTSSSAVYLSGLSIRNTNASGSVATSAGVDLSVTNSVGLVSGYMRLVEDSADSANGSLVFGQTTGSNNPPTERMRIHGTSGNVGIGTASPCSTCTLHVRGGLSATAQSQFDGDIYANGTNGLVLFSADPANYNISRSGGVLNFKGPGGIQIGGGGLSGANSALLTLSNAPRQYAYIGDVLAYTLDTDRNFKVNYGVTAGTMTVYTRASIGGAHSGNANNDLEIQRVNGRVLADQYYGYNGGLSLKTPSAYTSLYAGDTQTTINIDAQPLAIGGNFAAEGAGVVIRSTTTTNNSGAFAVDSQNGGTRLFKVNQSGAATFVSNVTMLNGGLLSLSKDGTGSADLNMNAEPTFAELRTGSFATPLIFNASAYNFGTTGKYGAAAGAAVFGGSVTFRATYTQFPEIAYLSFGDAWGASNAVYFRGGATNFAKFSSVGHVLNTGPLDFTTGLPYALGTTDANRLDIKTNNTTRLSINASGTADFSNGFSVLAGSAVVNAGGIHLPNVASGGAITFQNTSGGRANFAYMDGNNRIKILSPNDIHLEPVDGAGVVIQTNAEPLVGAGARLRVVPGTSDAYSLLVSSQNATTTQFEINKLGQVTVGSGGAYTDIPLTVQGDAGGNPEMMLRYNGAYWMKMGHNSLDVNSNPLIFKLGGVEKARVHTDGIFIGYGQRIQVNNATAPGFDIYNGAAPYAQIGVATADGHFLTGSKNGDLVLNATQSGAGISFGSYLTEDAVKMRLVGGKLGIGTTNPAVKLDVSGDAQFGAGVAKTTVTAAGLLKVSTAGIQWADGTTSTTATTASALPTLRSQLILSSGTFTPPISTTYTWTCVGGGGAGGNFPNWTGSGGGGSGYTKTGSFYMTSSTYVVIGNGGGRSPVAGDDAEASSGTYTAVGGWGGYMVVMGGKGGRGASTGVWGHAGRGGPGASGGGGGSCSANTAGGDGGGGASGNTGTNCGGGVNGGGGAGSFYSNSGGATVGYDDPAPGSVGVATYGSGGAGGSGYRLPGLGSCIGPSAYRGTSSTQSDMEGKNGCGTGGAGAQYSPYLYGGRGGDGGCYVVWFQ